MCVCLSVPLCWVNPEGPRPHCTADALVAALGVSSVQSGVVQPSHPGIMVVVSVVTVVVDATPSHKLRYVRAEARCVCVCVCVRHGAFSTPAKTVMTYDYLSWGWGVTIMYEILSNPTSNLPSRG